MSYSPLTVTRGFPVSPQLSAAGDTGIAITTKLRQPVYCFVSATQPSDADVEGGLEITHNKRLAITLLDGESLWIAAPHLAPGETLTSAVFLHHS